MPQHAAVHLRHSLVPSTLAIKSHRQIRIARFATEMPSSKLVWRDMERYGEIWRDVEIYGEIFRDRGRY